MYPVPFRQGCFQGFLIEKLHGCRLCLLDRKGDRRISVLPGDRGVTALQGVSVLTVATVIAELGNLRRVASASQLMAYLGLVPSEYLSGPKQYQGSITKPATLRRRAEHTPVAVQDIARATLKQLCGC